MASQYEQLLKIRKHISLLMHFVPEHMLGDIIVLHPLQAMEKLNHMAVLVDTLSSMPKTYEQDGKGDDAIAYLHYRSETRGIDWFITEKDMEEEQLQAFGTIAYEGQGSEMAYINLEDLISNEDVILCLGFNPMPIRQCLEYAITLNEKKNDSSAGPTMPYH